MGKVQTLEWGAFMRGDVVAKGAKSAVVPIDTKPKSKLSKLASVGLTMAVGITVSQALPALAAASGIATGAKSVAVFAAADPSFQTAISAATKPIKDIIFGFAGEIYFVFMAWGALEALIGKPQQGFTRMKVSTGAYILLYWVPWIVAQVNKTRPVVGW